MVRTRAFLSVALVLGACTATVPRPPAKLSAGEIGSYARPRMRTCADGNQGTVRVRRADLAAGPLLYPSAKLLARPGLRNGFSAAIGNYTGGGRLHFYKDGPYLSAGATATVSIAPRVARFARLDGGSSRPVLDEAVTYVACPRAGTWWVGGFDLIGRRAACVPLRVQIKGEPGPRTLVISLFHRQCPTP